MQGLTQGVQMMCFYTHIAFARTRTQTDRAQNVCNLHTFHGHTWPTPVFARYIYLEPLPIEEKNPTMRASSGEHETHVPSLNCRSRQ